MIYIAVLCNCNSTESLQNRSTILPLFIGPYAAATVRRLVDVGYVFVQRVLRISSDVDRASADSITIGVMAAVTALTAAMNTTAVSAHSLLTVSRKKRHPFYSRPFRCSI